MLAAHRARECTVIGPLGCDNTRFFRCLPAAVVAAAAVASHSRFYCAAQLHNTCVHCTPHSLAALAKTRPVNTTPRRRIHERRAVSPSYRSTSCCACLTWGCDGGSVAWNMRSASRENWRARCKSPTLRQLLPRLKHEMPMSGWLSGSTRRRKSSVFSPITRASWCRPSEEYVSARFPMAMPRAESVNLRLNQTETNHVAPMAGWFSGSTRR